MDWSPGIVILPFVFCAVPLVAQGWRAWCVVVVAGAALLGWGWSEIAPAASEASDADPTAAIAFLSVCTAAFAAGVAGRAAGLALRQPGRTRRRTLWIDSLALAVPAVLLLLLWQG